MSARYERGLAIVPPYDFSVFSFKSVIKLNSSIKNLPTFRSNDPLLLRGCADTAVVQDQFRKPRSLDVIESNKDDNKQARFVTLLFPGLSELSTI